MNDRKIFGLEQVCSDDLPTAFKFSRSRIMYVENKSQGLEGDARIGRVYFSKLKKAIYYQERQFQGLKVSGFKANYFGLESGDHYWISGSRKHKNDRLYGGNRRVEIDKNVRDEYSAYIRTLR